MTSGGDRLLNGRPRFDPGHARLQALVGLVEVTAALGRPHRRRRGEPHSPGTERWLFVGDYVGFAASGNDFVCAFSVTAEDVV